MANYLFISEVSLDLTAFNSPALVAGQSWNSPIITPPSSLPFSFDLTIVLGSFTPTANQALQIFKLPQTRTTPQLFADPTPTSLMGTMSIAPAAGVKSHRFENQWCPKVPFRLFITNLSGGATLATTGNEIIVSFHTEG